jgi:hypothetical protein
MALLASTGDQSLSVECQRIGEGRSRVEGPRWRDRARGGGGGEGVRMRNDQLQTWRFPILGYLEITGEFIWASF